MARSSAVRARSRIRRRLPAIASTKAIERAYARRIIQLMEVLRTQVDGILAELPALTSSIRAELRMDVGESAQIRDLVRKARATVRSDLDTANLEELAQRYAQQTTSFGRAQLARQLRASLGVSVFNETGITQLVESFTARNVALIQNIPDRALDSIEQIVLDGFSRGTSTRELSATISAQLGIADRRATTIARDQIGSLLGRVNAQRQRNLGVTQFIWRTVRDERVRKEHAQRDGVVYDYEKPPNGELPGEPINCRCYAEPVLDDLIGDD